MKRISLLTAFFVFIFAGSLFAASAVFFCHITGIIGYKYGCDTVKNAEENAYLFCINNGGKNPVCVDSNESGGYGVVMWAEDSGNKKWCSAVLSASSDAKAMKQANDMLISVGATRNSGYNRFYDPH